MSGLILVPNRCSIIGMSTPQLAELISDLQPIAGVATARQLAHQRSLPVATPLEGLVPYGGLVRGTTVAIKGRGAVMSLTFALIAEATRTGSWLVSVGFDQLNWMAAQEMGVRLDRVVTVELFQASAHTPAQTLAQTPMPILMSASARKAGPGRSVGEALAAEVISAAMDAAEMVMIAPGISLSDSLERRLQARARERGVVMLRPHPSDTSLRSAPASGRIRPVSSGLALEVAAVGWEGVGRGWGYANARWVEVRSSGRGVGAKVRRQRIWLPTAEGRVEVADTWPV